MTKLERMKKHLTVVDAHVAEEEDDELTHLLGYIQALIFVTAETYDLLEEGLPKPKKASEYSDPVVPR